MSLRRPFIIPHCSQALSLMRTAKNLADASEFAESAKLYREALRHLNESRDPRAATLRTQCALAIEYLTEQLALADTVPPLAKTVGHEDEKKGTGSDGR